MIYVFIAMPYGDHNDQETRLRNTHAAMDVFFCLADSGLVVPYCPHLSHFLHERSAREREYWLGHSRAWLSKCDCVLAIGIPSEGMRSEIAEASWRHIPVFRSLDELAEAYGIEHVRSAYNATQKEDGQGSVMVPQRID